MTKKVKVIRYTNPHYHAGCNVCDFYASRSTKETPEPEDVRNEVRKHVRKTGHECWIENGHSTTYSLIDDTEST